MSKQHHYTFRYDFSFQKSTQALEFKKTFNRKLGFIHQLPKTQEVSLKPCLEWNFSDKANQNRQIELKYQLKKELLNQFLRDNDLDYSPNHQEYVHFDLNNPLRTLNQIKSRIKQEKATQFEKQCRETYGWHGYEWYPYSQEEKQYQDYVKHMRNQSKNRRNNQGQKRKTSIIKRRESKSVQLQKKLFDEFDNKYAIDNDNTANDDISKEEIYTDNEPYDDDDLNDNDDDDPNDDSWETVANTKKAKKK